MAYAISGSCARTPVSASSTVATSPDDGPDPVSVASEKPTGWWRGDTFYEIFVRSFADEDGDGVGDFAGLTAKLDYLNDGDPETTTDLGVDAIWLMPIHPSPSYHGYDVTDYDEVNPDYGGGAAFDVFLKAAHDRGLRVIIDFVLNHSSSEHPWFIDARTGPGAKFRDHFVWRKEKPTEGFARPWDGANTWHANRDDFYYGLFWSGMPDLNLANPEVEKKLVASMRGWLARGVDGFRVDAVRYLVETEDGVVADTAQTHAVAKRIYRALAKDYPEVFLVGEAWTSLEDVAPYYGEGGNEFQGAFGFDVAAAIKTSVTDGNRADLNQVLSRTKRAYADVAWEAPFLANHDMARVMRTFAGDRANARVAAATLFAMVGTPFVYYGEEIGMQGGAESRDEDKRTPMRWTEDGPGHGFTTGTPWHSAQEDRGVAVSAQRSDPSSLWNLYRRLIALRRVSPPLSQGSISQPKISGGGRGVTAVLRAFGEQRVLFVVNFDRSTSAPFSISVDGTAEVLLSEGTDGVSISSDGEIGFSALKGKGFVYLVLR